MIDVISKLLDAVLVISLALITPFAARNMRLPTTARKILIIYISVFAAVSLLAIGHDVASELSR